MGGVVFDNSNDPVKIWPQGIDRLILTPRFIVWCFQNGYEEAIPTISEKGIKDKAKANGFAKTLICVQAIWFCLQFITRLAQRLPVSLLEGKASITSIDARYTNVSQVNTFAHAICALLIYSLWWSKPLDIEEPVLIPTDTSDDIRSLCAQASTCSFLDSYMTCGTIELDASLSGKVSIVRRLLWTLSVLRGRLYDACSPTSRHYAPLTYPWYYDRLGFDCNVFAVTDKPIPRNIHKNILGLRLSPSWRQSTSLHNPQNPRVEPDHFNGIDGSLKSYNFTSIVPPVILLRRGDHVPKTNLVLEGAELCEMDERMLARLQWASRFCEEGRDPISTDYINYYLARASYNRLYAGWLKLETGNFSRAPLDPGSHFPNKFSLPSNVSMILSSILYGGLHALAFDGSFHSAAESILWKISCLCIAGTGVLAVPCLSIIHFLQDHDRQTFWETSLGKKLRATTIVKLLRKLPDPPTLIQAAFEALAVLWAIGAALITMAGVLFYFFCRVYLIVEVFLNLPYVDPRVYETPNWSVYWPHIS